MYFLMEEASGVSYAEDLRFSKIPVSPSPEEAEQIQPNRDLPWTNTFHSAFVFGKVRVRTAWSNGLENDFVQLSYDEQARFQIRVGADRQQRLHLESLNLTHGGFASGDDSDTLHFSQNLNLDSENIEESQDDIGWVADDHVSESTFDPFNDDEDEESEEGDQSDVDQLGDLLEQCVASAPVADDTLPVVSISYDLSSVPVLPDPRDFFREVEALDRYELFDVFPDPP